MAPHLQDEFEIWRIVLEAKIPLSEVKEYTLYEIMTINEILGMKADIQAASREMGKKEIPGKK
jgi:hypothetical protein